MWEKGKSLWMVIQPLGQRVFFVVVVFVFINLFIYFIWFFCFFVFFFSVTAPFYLEDSRRIQDSKRREWRSAWGGRKRERAHACTRERESERKRFGSSFYMFFLPPGPALCKFGLARSAVCSAWSFHSGPRTFLWPSLSFSHRHFGLLFPILPT